MNELPPEFIQTQHELYGDAGKAWLANLPTLIAACEQRWSIQVGAPFQLSYNFAAPARNAEGEEFVLKLGVPNPELQTEIGALRHSAGRGICTLVDFDEAQGILLLERLRPGTMLSTVADDEQATAIAAEVMRQLWRPAPAEHNFPTMAKWGQGLTRLRKHYEGGTGPFPPKLVEQAEALYQELDDASAPAMLLHGDLHHFNILRAERAEWLAIDPKGLVGEPAYEIGALLRNPSSELVLNAQVQARRIAQLSDMLALDRQRIINWGIAQAVLSAWWSVEDHGYGGEEALALAELLAGLKV